MRIVPRLVTNYAPIAFDDRYRIDRRTDVTDGWLRLQMNYDLSQARKNAHRIKVTPVDAATI